MPMFDDPKKELQWLQEQLLAEEENVSPQEPDFDEELDDILRLIGEEATPRVSRETAVRNFANNYGQEEEDEEEDSDALYCDEISDAPKEKEKGIGGLVFLAVLETLGILAVAAWWVKFLWL